MRQDRSAKGASFFRFARRLLLIILLISCVVGYCYHLLYFGRVISCIFLAGGYLVVLRCFHTPATVSVWYSTADPPKSPNFASLFVCVELGRAYRWLVFRPSSYES